MKFILICGAPASGKMTVGMELQKLTGYKLFHNHMSIEFVRHFFDFGDPSFRKLDDVIRFSVFEEIANSNIEGLIFTLVWAFNEKEDEEYVDRIIKTLEKRNPDAHIVELGCELEERLRRNKGALRLANKASKRDLEYSEKVLLKHEEEYRFHSLPNEFPEKNIFKIENTNLTAAEVARRIQQQFNLPMI